MPREWQPLVNEMTPVGKLVHLAMRRDAYDVEEQRTALLRMMRRAYESELRAMAQRVGCGGRTARLNNGAVLSELNDQAQEWARGIANTYNYDLAQEVGRIRTEAPRANRNTYAARVQEWHTERSAWKDKQIADYADSWARAKAQSDFRDMNNTMGTAQLEPKTGVCPVCLGIIARGDVPLREALKEPPPYHPNCCTPGTLVRMTDGSERSISTIGVGDAVACRSGSTQVVQVHQRHVQEALYQVHVEGRVLEVTGDHPVLTDRGWLAARDLQAGDVVVVQARDIRTGDT